MKLSFKKSTITIVSQWVNTNKKRLSIDASVYSDRIKVKELSKNNFNIFFDGLLIGNVSIGNSRRVLTSTLVLFN